MPWISLIAYLYILWGVRADLLVWLPRFLWGNISGVYWRRWSSWILGGLIWKFGLRLSNSSATMKIDWKWGSWGPKLPNGTKSLTRTDTWKVKNWCWGTPFSMLRMDQWLSWAISAHFRSTHAYACWNGKTCAWNRLPPTPLEANINNQPDKDSPSWPTQEKTWSIWEPCCPKWITEDKSIKSLWHQS